jgi:hypothetical protein
MKVRKSLIASMAVAFISAGAMAQDQVNGGGNQGGNQSGNNGGNRGNRNWDPAAMQQRMLDTVKEQMKAPDDEWKVIEPKLLKVMAAQRDARAGGGFGRGGPGGGGGGNRGNDQQPQQPQTELAKASRELRDLLAQENASPDQISAKLTAFRAARTKAEAELKAARESLKEVLNERQEALLVTMGMVE